MKIGLTGVIAAAARVLPDAMAASAAPVVVVAAPRAEIVRLANAVDRAQGRAAMAAEADRSAKAKARVRDNVVISIVVNHANAAKRRRRFPISMSRSCLTKKAWNLSRAKSRSPLARIRCSISPV